MAKNNVTITNKLKEDLKKYSNKYCVGIASKIGAELTETTFDALVKFYTSWSPKYYNRHYYNFMENSFRKYYQNAHNSIVRGGVELTPYRMDDVYNSVDSQNRIDVDYIFNLVYLGYHGNIKMINNDLDVEIMNPSPFDIIINRRDYIVNNISIYKRYGEVKAQKESYSTLF